MLKIRYFLISLILILMLSCDYNPIVITSPYIELQLEEIEYIPAAVLGKFYSVQLQAIGGFQPYEFDVIGGEFPPGLQCNSSGLIYGVPTKEGRFEFYGFVSDSGENYNQEHYDAGKCVIVVSGTIPLTITTTSLPNAQTGIQYNTRVNVIGGTPPYSYSCQGLPLGLYLTSPGNTIIGYAQQVGTFQITFCVEDHKTATDIAPFTLTVLP